MSMETKITQNAINFNHISECIGDLSDSRSALEQQIASLRADLTALVERSRDHDEQFGKLFERLDAIEEVVPVYRPCMCPGLSCDGSCQADNHARYQERQRLLATPPQPTAVCGCGNPDPNHRHRIPGFESQPTAAAEGDEAKWRSVGEETLSAWERGLSWANIGKAAIDESIELGLAARPISADDEAQQDAVIELLEFGYGSEFPRVNAKRFLRRLAAAQQEASK